MSVMTTRRSEASERPLTVDDLARIPDDGRRYELVDGRRDVSPAPSLIHSTVDTRLTYLLISLCPKGSAPTRGRASTSRRAEPTTAYPTSR